MPARLLADDPAKWRKFARAAAATPEGYAMFRGGKGGVPATQVLAAWWTDAAGRKHVVLRGRRVEHDEAKRLLQKDELETRPPLWHAYPEYVCRRTVGKESQIVCACGCGAVGTPEALGWMGETCGPCSDRKEELGTGALSANAPGVLYGDRAPLGAVACSPDGTRVAAVEGENCVAYWDITTRTRTVMKFSGARVTDAAVTSDGAHLLVVGVNVLALGGLYAAFDLSADPPKRVDPADGPQPPGWRVAALPDPGRAVVHRPDYERDGTLGVTVGVPSGEPVNVVRLPPGYHGRLAVAPEGKRIATVGTEVNVFDLDSGRRVRTLPVPFPLVGFSNDGKRLVGTRGSFRAYDLTTGKLLAEGGLDGTRGRPPGDGTLAVAVDPAGEFVYAGSWQGKVYVFAADTLALRAVFEWHLGAVQGLAVSADGARLFSAGGDGCVKVWPIKDLMR